MKNWIFRFFVLMLALSSAVAHADEIPSGQPALFSPKERLAFLPQIPKINVVTGEYCDEECDLQVAGIEPLSINRFYNHHTGLYNRCYGHWRVNPETFMLFNFEKIGGGQTFTAVGESNSSFFVYEQPVNSGYVIDAAKNRSFTNTPSLFSGQNHPLNTRVFYNKGHIVRTHPKSLRLQDDCCWWEGHLKDGSGRERSFRTDIRQWPQAGKEWPCHKSRHPSSGEIFKTPLEFIAPYQAQITEERRPNGNIIRYEYEDVNASNSSFDHELPTSYLLKSIKAYSKKGILLGSIEASYSGGINNARKPDQWIDQVVFTGSDGRKATLFNQQRHVNTRSNHWDTVLNHVDAAGKPTQFYQYRWDSAKDYYRAPFMSHTALASGVPFETHYDPKTKKAMGQCAPVGPNNQMAAIARYEYQDDHTVVFDGENNKTIYRYNTDKRITAIEKYQGNQLYSIERNEWNPQNGNLMRKKLEDASGKLYNLQEYDYDKNHNPLIQRMGHILYQIEGDLIYRSFSDDGFNLKLTESARPGKEVKYTYLPGTNLLTSELTYLNGHICKRAFYFYDSEIDSLRIKTIYDDGKSDNPYDLSGITFRKIVEVSPKRSLPCLGLAEEVREKTIDAHGHEILLSKVCYTYHPSGQIIREDHFDAQNVHRYSVVNEYDPQERLISTTNPLGHKTTFGYDAQFNRISQSGPRSDMHKEWLYDAANRPIQEKEWQTDGTILITEKRYDKLSRIISTLDACGFETRYEYDALGRITALYHPDGSCERKEYDVLGNVTQQIDPNGYSTRKEYNFRGQPTSITMNWATSFARKREM